MPKKKRDLKTIKLSIYFWTNIEGTEGIKMPKRTCWDSGFVDIVSNNRHAIRSGVHKNFNNMEQLPEAIMDVLKRSNVRVISSKKGKDYKEALKLMKDSELISN